MLFLPSSCGSLAVSVATHGSSWSVRCEPARPVNGSPILFQIKPPSKLRNLAGKWQDHVVYFEFDTKSDAWIGIAGASLPTAPGSYPLVLSGTTLKDEKVSFQRQI